MLHHPFRDVGDLLLSFDGHDFQDWTAALNYCVSNHVDLYAHDDFSSDGFGELPEVVEEDNEFELYEDKEENDLFWAELAAQRPGRDGGHLEDADALGNRDVDRAFDWSPFVNKYPDLTGDWLDNAQERFPKSLEVDYASQSIVDKLNLKQRQVYDTTMEAFRSDVEIPQLLLHVDGRAGTGKSFVIQLTSAHLQQAFEHNPVLRAAPTGVASHGILGRTLHSLFRLPVKSSKFAPLSPGNLASLQASMRHIKALFIDEKSMMSLQILSLLDQRLRQIFPHSNQPFGGLHIVLWGDFFQLPPVKALALFNDSPDLRGEHDVAGQALYKLFDRTIELDMIMRQQGEDTEQQQFRAALEGLRNNHVTQDDWRLLSTRVQSSLNRAEVATFDEALRVYGKKADVNAYNHEKMKALGVAVKQVKAHHTGSGADGASWDDGGNLHKSLPLCIGARVMLTENRWTERGLVNGALGTIKDFHWPEGADIDKDLPTILVAFDKYDGPCIDQDEKGRQIVPITPSRREFQVGNTACTRTQLPVTIAFAITVHKSQGITADKIVTNIAQRDHVIGLSYVAISRVKTLKGLLFEEPFDFIRFQVNKVSKTETMRLADVARRLRQHIPVAVPDLE